MEDCWNANFFTDMFHHLGCNDNLLVPILFFIAIILYMFFTAKYVHGSRLSEMAETTKWL